MKAKKGKRKVVKTEAEDRLLREGQRSAPLSRRTTLIEVGMSWQNTLQVSEQGSHRPPVGGISGTEKSKDKSKRGTQSIVQSGGYKDDVDSRV
jgi:hypothetical protein